jgi:hypothetical protein
MKKNNYPIFLLIFLFLTYGCQDVKKGIAGKKIDQGEEFLVIKKNPLVVPPDFEKMPLPKNEIDNTNSIVTENDQDNSFEKFLEINDEDFDKSNSNINTGDLEDKIIEKIK